jgi:hypothetical protein
MAVTSTTATTYERRLVGSADSSNSTFALFKIDVTTTVRTAPDSPVGTTVSAPVETFLAIDYTPSYSNLAEQLTEVSNKIQQMYELASGNGIHTKGPQDWIGLVSTYKLYVENVGPENVTLQGLIAYKAKIDALPKDF